MVSIFVHIDSNLGSSSASSTNSSSSSLCVTPLSSSSTATSTYANSTWGAGCSSPSSSQGCEKVIVDGTDLGDWPRILSGAKLSSDGDEGGVKEQICPSKNSSASWGERDIQQKGGVVGGGAGKMDNPSSTCSSPLSSSSSLNECVQSSGVWGSTSSQLEAGLGSESFYNSKVSQLLGQQENPAGGNSSVSGANFNPSMNPSSWPTLVCSAASTSASDHLPLHSSVTSSSFSASTSLVTTHSLSSLNQTGVQHQKKHTDTVVGARSGEQQQYLGSPLENLGSSGEVRGSGPNQEGGDERNCGIATVEEEGSVDLSCISTSSSAATTSWRCMPPVSSELSAGSLQADRWGGGGARVQGQEGNVWGLINQADQAGCGRENNGGSNTPVVSQGASEGSTSRAEWSGTVGGAGSSSLAIGSGTGENGSSDSTSSGGSVLEESASPKFATMTKAWDNQKGMEGVNSAVGEWGGQGGEAGGERPPTSSKGGSKAESGGDGSDTQKQEGGSDTHCNSKKTSSAEVALLSMLSRSDLDPRVLSNTGWGQTQIRQNVAWDLDSTRGVANRNERSTSSSSAFSSAAIKMVTSCGPGYQSNSSSLNNDSSVDSHTTQSSCGPHMPGHIGMPGENLEGNQGKSAGGWGDLQTEQAGKGWVGEEQEWGDNRSKGGNWRDLGAQGSGWADLSDDKRGRTGGWKGTGGVEAGGWGGQSKGGGDWILRDTLTAVGIGDGRNRGESSSDEGSSWGNMEEGGSQRGGWRGDVGGSKSEQEWVGAKPHTTAAQIPNSKVLPMNTPNQQQHQSQGQHPQGVSIQSGWNSQSSFGRGGPMTKHQNQSSGWTSGPIPQISGAGESLEPSGWEEPSPQSISRKVEIDDGTSAWGDPTRCNKKNVNLWDKNKATPNQSQNQQGPPPMQHQPPRRQLGMQHNRDPNPGNAVVGEHKHMFKNACAFDKIHQHTLIIFQILI